MKELKSCPFCGSTNVGTVNVANFALDIWQTYCRECFSRTMPFATEREAIEAWNRRVNDETDKTPTVDAVPVVRCKDCVNGNMDRGFFWCCSSGMVVNVDDFCSYGERKDDGI